MTTPTNPANRAMIGDSDWQRLSTDTLEYVAASYELIGKARVYLRDGDLRQASEKGWGAAAQIVKAVAENWRDSGVTHGRHQDLRGLVNGLVALDSDSGLKPGFRAAQNLHENFYEDDDEEDVVAEDITETERFITAMLPYLRNPSPPQGFRQGYRQRRRRFSHR